MSSTLSRDQQGEEKKSHTVYSLFDGANEQLVVEQLLKTSFYLPKDIYQNPNILVQTLVLSHADWTKYVAEHGLLGVYQADSTVLIYRARYVGMSIRIDTKNNQVYRVVKVWWGNPPKVQLRRTGNE